MGDKQADQSETKAQGEKDLVSKEIEMVKTKDCGCTWEQWAGNWGECSKTCGEGTKKQSRKILWQKRNKGQECDLADGEESATCNEGCCPVNCVWADWKPWGDCPNVCSAEPQYMLRTRDKKVSMQCPDRGGKECEGSPNEAKSCKIMDVWNGKIAELETKHGDLLTLIALYKEKLCDPNPCANGGSCKEGVCTCTTEFEGHHCKTPKEKKDESSKKNFVKMLVRECPSGQAVLEKDCERACAKVGGKRLASTGSWHNSPKGCTIVVAPTHFGQCYFNRHPTGRKDKSGDDYELAICTSG